MKHFVPNVNKESALSEWEKLKNTVEAGQGRPFSSRKIYRMSYTHDGARKHSVVGEEEPDYNGSQVLAIFESEDSTMLVSIFRQRNGVINCAMTSNSGTNVTDFDSQTV